MIFTHCFDYKAITKQGSPAIPDIQGMIGQATHALVIRLFVYDL